MNEHYPKTTREDFEKIIANYKIKKHYPKTDFNIGDSRFGIYINGKEDIDVYVKQNDTTSLAGYLSSLALSKIDVEQIFSIDKSQLRYNEVPILVNYSQAYNIAGEKKIESENQEQVFNQARRIRNKVIGKSFEMCWRNEKSVEAIKNALYTNQDSDSEVKYRISESDCSSPEIIKGSDPQFIKNLSQLKSKKIIFRVVGVVPDFRVPTASNGVAGLLNGFSVSTIDNFSSPAIVPINMLADNLSDDNLDIFNQTISTRQSLYTGQIDDIIEFETREEMNRFISEVHCKENYCGKEKTVGVSVLSNNYKIIDEINDSLNRVRIISSVVAIFVASIVVYLTVNRVMVDSRKETAIFRAIGYSRVDIVQIYFSYIAIFSLIVALLVNLFLLLISMVVSANVEPEVGLYFSNLFMTESKYKFKIFSYSWQYLGLFLPVFGVGVLASVIPLLVNSRRSPLKNLRSE